MVNNAAMNIGVQISVWVPAFSCFGCMPRSGIAGSCFMFFEEPPNYFLWQLHYFITVSPTIYTDSNFSMSLTTRVICCCCCFEKSNPNACKVTSHCDFIVISLQENTNALQVFPSLALSQLQFHLIWTCCWKHQSLFHSTLYSRETPRWTADLCFLWWRKLGLWLAHNP